MTRFRIVLVASFAALASLVAAASPLPPPISGDFHPTWSPDGRHVAFFRSDGDEAARGLYRVNVATRALTRLTNERQSVTGLDWSPDGARLVYAKTLAIPNRPPPAEQQDVLTIGSNGANVQNITGSETDEFAPVWSPDGRRVAFVASASGRTAIAVMNADGSGRRSLTVGPGNDLDPAWSSAGRIVFARSTADGNRSTNLFELGADGAEPQEVTSDGTHKAHPSWSPDDAKIVFEGEGGLHVVTIATRMSKRLTSGMHPEWSPNGRQIAFVDSSGPGRRPSIYVIDVDGKGKTRLTASPDVPRTVDPACTVVGTTRSDELRGTARRDVLCGLAGNDVALGRAGDDSIFGALGDDRLSGGGGPDELDGGGGRDRIDARDADRDLVACGPGNDVVWADKTDSVHHTCETVIRRR